MSDTKKLQHWQPFHDRRRHQYWRAALVGLGSGAMALFFQSTLEQVELFRVGLLEHLHADHSSYGWLVLPLIAGSFGAFTGWLVSRFAPEASGSGIPHVKGVLLHVNQLPWARVIPVKFIGGLLCTGAGFALGREGPTIQMGASIGKMIGDMLRVPTKAAPRLMACGAGAGMAAAFHAPLAGFIFVIEELQREFSSLTYIMALIAAVVADIIATSFHGNENAFHATGFPAADLVALPTCALVGVLGGLLGSGFNKALLGSQYLCHERFKTPQWLRAGVIGIIVGLVAWWWPELTGGGHHTVERLLHGDDPVLFSTRVLCTLLVGKMIFSLVCYMAGVPGGIFAPMLVMGASLGVVTGMATAHVFPTMAPIPASFAAIGMAAFFSAMVRAPLTGIVLVLEMTGDYNQLLPLIIASMIAFVISERLGIEPLYDALLAYDLKRRGNPHSTAHGEPVLLEFVVEEGSSLDGQPIKAIDVPRNCLFVTIHRGCTEVLPDGDTTFHRGDHVTAVISGADAAESVAKVLALSKV